MNDFTPVSALIGGLLIGTSAALFLVLNGPLRASAASSAGSFSLAEASLAGASLSWPGSWPRR